MSKEGRNTTYPLEDSGLLIMKGSRKAVLYSCLGGHYLYIFGTLFERSLEGEGATLWQA